VMTTVPHITIHFSDVNEDNLDYLGDTMCKKGVLSPSKISEAYKSGTTEEKETFETLFWLILSNPYLSAAYCQTKVTEASVKDSDYLNIYAEEDRGGISATTSAYIIQAITTGHIGDTKKVHELYFQMGFEFEIEKDYKEALKWYRKLEEEGNVERFLAIARLYRKGLGVEKNLRIAISYCKQATEKDPNWPLAYETLEEHICKSSKRKRNISKMNKTSIGQSNAL
jgi:tetratricopeptide (TPR) repeat protein